MTTRLWWSAGLVLLLFVGSACTFESRSLDEVTCTTDGDCAPGKTCVGGFCQVVVDAIIDMEDLQGDGEEDQQPLDLCGDRVCEFDEQCCNDTCVFLNARDYCGSCDLACDNTQECSLASGGCVCAVGLSDCDMASSGCETNLLTSAEHCGTCGNACGADESCDDGRCACGDVTCGSAQTCCPDMAGPTCRNTQTNAEHCGDCGVTCRPGETCGDGQCACGTGPGCGMDQLCCDGTCVTGDVCGCGGVDCAATEPLCCDDGMGNMACQGFDDANCGGCGLACGGGQVCQGGACECIPGATECGTSCVDTDTDAAHCGMCDNACGMGESCCNGGCIDVCDWWDPDYLYRRRIDIATGGAIAPSGYSVKLTFDHLALVMAGQARPDGEDVRIVRWNAGMGSWEEIARTTDFFRAWEQTDTTLLFPLADGLPDNSTDSTYFLYYGYTGGVDPPSPPGGWANVYKMAATFNGSTIPSFVTADLDNGANTWLDGDDLWLNMSVDLGSNDQAGTIGWNVPLSRPPAVEIRAEAQMDYATSTALVRMLGVRQSNGFPGNDTSSAVNAEERFGFVENRAGQVWPIYRATDGTLRVWDDSASNWKTVTGRIIDEKSWSFSGYGERVYLIQCDGVDVKLSVLTNTLNPTVLGETDPFAYSDVRDDGNDLWLVWGEPMTNSYRADMRHDWVQVRDLIAPEPTAVLSPVVDRF